MYHMLSLPSKSWILSIESNLDCFALAIVLGFYSEYKTDIECQSTTSATKPQKHTHTHTPTHTERERERERERATPTFPSQFQWLVSNGSYWGPLNHSGNLREMRRLKWIKSLTGMSTVQSWAVTTDRRGSSGVYLFKPQRLSVYLCEVYLLG